MNNVLGDLQTIWTPVIIVVVPIVVAYLKRFLGDRKEWIPVLAAGLGAVAATATLYAGQSNLKPVAGLILGLAGIGLRELVNQFNMAPQAKRKKK